MRVLLVDDDERSRESLADLLTRSGYSVSGSGSGRQALQRLEGSSFRLVITEWQLPDMTAAELCRIIRANKASGYIYMVILTECAEQANIVAGFSAGADDFIAKPFDPAELLLRVSACKRIAALGAGEVAVFALAKLAESRDTETGQHLERIRNYCWILGRRLRQDFLRSPTNSWTTSIRRATLHDIGKVGIPDSVLLKPGRLTKEEYDVMKTHYRPSGPEPCWPPCNSFPT